MGLSKEIFRPKEADVALSNPSMPGSSEIKASKLSITEAGMKGRISELSRMLSSEGQKGNEAEKQPRKENPRNDGFEPFVNNPEPTKENLFVNRYDGNYATQMVINRKAVERVLEIAHLDGQIVLVSLSPSRSRAEAQGNELVAKRFRFFGEKVEKEEEENPISRVVSIPEGWRIEINDTRIREELAEQEKLSGKELQRVFIKKFNGFIKEGLRESVLREKFSSEKDEYFRRKLFSSMVPPAISFTTSIPILLTGPLIYVAIQFGWTLCSYGIFNLLCQKSSRMYQDLESSLKMIDPNFKRLSSPFRKIDHKWEYFMPPVEVDRVAITFAYLSINGRNLVKETKQPKIK